MFICLTAAVCPVDAVQDPLGAGRTSGSESASARSLAVAYSTLSKVLSALRNTSAGAASALGQAAAAAAAAASITSQQQQQQLLQHVPWRDSPLTRWLQDQLHAANAIVVLGTISTELEVRGRQELAAATAEAAAYCMCQAAASQRCCAWQLVCHLQACGISETVAAPPPPPPNICDASRCRCVSLLLSVATTHTGGHRLPHHSHLGQPLLCSQPVRC